MASTLRFGHRHLPHWEVEQGRYFVTVRCADSLPKDAVLRLAELSQELSRLTPASAQFAALQRETFCALDKYLDKGVGTCPLKRPDVAISVRNELDALSAWNVSVPHFTLMPNHWHAMIVPPPDGSVTLSAIMKRIKGRTARHIRALLGGSGPVWQSEWFDRWMRSDAEWDKCVAYIRNNPVKAALVKSWTEHPWTR
jgi:REP element-mobilizing transposase RayT